MGPVQSESAPRGAVDRRVSPRKVRFAKVWVAREGQPAPSFRVPLINISLNGVFLRSPVRPPTGEMLALRIDFAAGPQLDVSVAVTRQDDEGFGCRIVAMGDSDRTTLQYWMGPYGALAPADATSS